MRLVAIRPGMLKTENCWRFCSGVSCHLKHFQATQDERPLIGPCDGNDLLARPCKTLVTSQDPNPDDLKNQLFIQQTVLLCTDPSTVYLLDSSVSTNPLLTRSSSIVP